MLESPAALTLARIQFAFTVSFHFVFPAFSIGLASYLAVLEGLWLRTGRETYLNLFQYWLKIFAITFAMGVVSGIVMSYQFGTNWSVFSDRAGPVIGPLMAYEVLTAFFLEAGFLGVMLFGLTRVGRGLHFTATLAVAAGTLVSAFWILSANSWMHTPAGHSLNAAGQFVPEDWLAIIFNPSMPYRLAHTVLAAYLTTSLVVGAVGAFHLRRDPGNEGARTMFSMAMWMAVLVAPIQVVVGDLHGLSTFEHQPAKVMAMEGHFESHEAGAPLLLVGLPDQAAGVVRYAVSIPRASSLILRHDANAPLAGLDTVPREDWPPVAIVFWSFRVMVGLGVLILALGIGVNGKTLGIYAYGKIGSIVAGVGKAFGARVVCWGREGSTGRARAAGFEVAKSRADFFAECDVLSLHLPLNKDTRGIVTRDDLARMKPTALLVNPSRSGLIAKGALEEALKAGRPGKAAVDVYDQEPVLGGEHPLLKMANATCTPHLGYVTRESYEEYYAVVVDDILAFATGKPSHVLNPDAVGKK